MGIQTLAWPSLCLAPGGHARFSVWVEPGMCFQLPEWGKDDEMYVRLFWEQTHFPFLACSEEAGRHESYNHMELISVNSP